MAEPSKPDAGRSFSDVLHQKRGIGYSSRFRVSNNLSPGWRQEQKSSKYIVWFDDLGNGYRSSVEVERALKETYFQRPVKMRRRRKRVVKPRSMRLLR